MNAKTMTLLIAAMLVGANAGAGTPFYSTSLNRVRTRLDPGLMRIGTLAQRSVSEIEDGGYTIGCECLDRDYCDFSKYRDYLPLLGIKTIRLQGGWAKCEKEKGRYDFRWMDEIVDWALAHGMRCQIQTSYANPIYFDGPFRGAQSTIPFEGAYFEAWKAWVAAYAKHFAGRVDEWEMWNEPNNNPSNTTEIIVKNNIATAEIIRTFIPNAKISAIVLGHDDGFEPLAKALAASGKAGLFDYYTVHIYDLNPAHGMETNILWRQRKLEELGLKLALRQGESGAVSEMVENFGYRGVPFTEISQAKLALQRMLVDKWCGLNTTVFTISDICYAGLDASIEGKFRVELNCKGLLRANQNHDIIAVKRAFYAVQNCVGLFDGTVTPLKESSFLNRDTTVFFREWKSANGSPMLVFWEYEKRKVLTNVDALPTYERIHDHPGDSFETRPAVFHYSGAPLKEPVWVDLLSGRVYALPPESQIVHATGVTFVDVPVYDSPCVLTERSALRIGEGLRLGMAGYTFKAVRDADAMLDRVRQLGIRYLCVKDFHLPFSATDEDIRAFLGKCRAHDVTPYAIGPVYMKDEAKAVECFEFAKRLGVGLVVGVPYEVAPGKEDVWGPDRLESRKLCEFVSGLCQKYDMRFAIHNHGPSLPNLFPDAASVWRKISDLDPRMGICLDLAHERRSGVEPAESVRRYAGRIFDVHLNNIEDASDPDKYLATTLPKGVIDVSGVCSALKDIGYGGVLAIEYAKNFEDNMVDLRESVEHFRQINEEGM